MTWSLQCIRLNFLLRGTQVWLDGDEDDEHMFICLCEDDGRALITGFNGAVTTDRLSFRKEPFDFNLYPFDDLIEALS